MKWGHQEKENTEKQEFVEIYVNVLMYFFSFVFYTSVFNNIFKSL